MNTTIIQQVPNLMTHAKAAALAATLQASDPDWTYQVRCETESQAYVECLDEAGTLVGLM